MKTPTPDVELAIDIGYRLIDCAFIHRNETEVGCAINKKIREGVVERDDLFIIGKVRFDVTGSQVLKSGKLIMKISVAALEYHA